MFDIIAWIGAFAYVLGYLLLSLGFVSAKLPSYHLLNVLGAICLIINAIHLRDTPNLVVNAIWLLIAILAIVKILLKSPQLKS